MRFAYGTRTILTPPKELNRRLARVGGLNRFNEPNFRVVWGGSRLAWIGGRFEQEKFVGTVMEPKYGAALEQWHVECWRAPEFYGDRESWERQFTQVIDGVSVDTLGPFPSRGDYESIVSFPPVPLNAATCDAIVQLVERSRSLTRSERKTSVTSGLDKQAKDWDKFADDILDDAMPAFYGAPHAAGFRSVKEKNV